MGKTDISIIAIKLLALYLIASGIIQIPNAFILANLDPHQDIWGNELIVFIAAVLSPLTLGFFLLILSEKIGLFISPKTNDNKKIISQTSDVPSISFAVLGLYLTFLTLNKISYFIASFYYTNLTLNYDQSYFESPSFIAYIVTLIFSLSLFIGVKFWVKLYYVFKEFGLKKKASNKAIKKDV